MWFIIAVMLVCGSEPHNRHLCVRSTSEHPTDSEVKAQNTCRVMLADPEMGIIECRVEKRELEWVQ